jgi:acetyltransferase
MEKFTDPSQDFIRKKTQPLDAIFEPKSIAVIGAKDDPNTVGKTLMHNLVQGGFQGPIYPVNPKRKTVLGLKCYPDVQSLPEAPDLAILITKAKVVPAVLRECASKGVKGCIVISAGFKEAGKEGIELENELVQIAREAKIPLIGPNCLGVMNPGGALNATFAKGMALPGNIAFISQSGAMCTSVLDWSLKEKIGFSAFVSIGSMADADWGDLIDYLGNDPKTEAMLLYMETVGEPRKFLSAAREIAREKPIIVIKGGRTEEAAKAAASHTGALAGSDDVFNAAVERVGVLRVDTIAELFQMASVLSRQPKPNGPRLTIVTNAGGPAVLATDATIKNGATLAPVGEATLRELNQLLPPAWSHGNPIDLLGDATPDRYAEVLSILSNDQESDGVLVVLTPQDMTDPEASAKCVAPWGKKLGKPLLASWMGGESVQSGIDQLNLAKVPTFEYPDDAARAFALMWEYSKTIQLLYQLPEISPLEIPQSKNVGTILTQNKTLLDEFESKKVLEAYGIPTVRTETATDVETAVTLAKEIGFPVVLKLYSHTITHKSDVGGVKLNLNSAEDVRNAYQAIERAVDRSDFQGVTVQKMVKMSGYELIIGSSVDPQFGPVILFGTGGQLVEVYKDRALALPPLNQTLAGELIKKTKVYEALKGVRGREGIDFEALEKVLERFSALIVENPSIKECDINPLLASHEGFIALDARIVLYKEGEKRAKLSIRPYPSEYVKKEVLKSGEEILIRPIRPEDEKLLVQFHKELSEHSVRQRYFEFVSLDQRIARERLIRICFNDFDREIAMVAERPGTEGILGVARISRVGGTAEGVLTMIILDGWQGKGLGAKLLDSTMQAAKNEGVKKVSSYILDENSGMLHISEKAGFVLNQEDGDRIVHAVLE